MASVAILFGAWWIQNVDFVNATASGDVVRAERAARQLAWIQRDAPDLYVRIGQLKVKSSDLAGARESYLRSLAVSPTADAYLGLGALDEADGRWSDAVVTYDLLVSIFHPATPLHDGAVVIQGNRVAAAACFLPLTVNPELSRTLGSRHRAAIGLSEDTDAVAIVVSEETGVISLVEDGRIRRGLDGPALKQALLATSTTKT